MAGISSITNPFFKPSLPQLEASGGFNSKFKEKQLNESKDNCKASETFIACNETFASTSLDFMPSKMYALIFLIYF